MIRFVGGKWQKPNCVHGGAQFGLCARRPVARYAGVIECSLLSLRISCHKAADKITIRSGSFG